MFLIYLCLNLSLDRYNYRSIGDAMMFTRYLDEETSYAPIQVALSQLQYVTDVIVDDKLKTCLKVRNILKVFCHLNSWQYCQSRKV